MKYLKRVQIDNLIVFKGSIFNAISFGNCNSYTIKGSINVPTMRRHSEQLHKAVLGRSWSLPAAKQSTFWNTALEHFSDLLGVSCFMAANEHWLFPLYIFKEVLDYQLMAPSSTSYVKQNNQAIVYLTATSRMFSNWESPILWRAWGSASCSNSNFTI